MKENQKLKNLAVVWFLLLPLSFILRGKHILFYAGCFFKVLIFGTTNVYFIILFYVFIFRLQQEDKQNFKMLMQTLKEGLL